MKCELLPPCYDIDTWQNVERLMHDMQIHATNDTTRCPQTKKVITDLAPVLSGNLKKVVGAK
jgi:hypothetical protein